MVLFARILRILLERLSKTFTLYRSSCVLMPSIIFGKEEFIADKTERAPLILTDEQRQELQTTTHSRTAPVREVQRAKILLDYADRGPLATPATRTRTSRPTVYKCINKALSMGWEAGLKDLYHRPKDPVITPEAKAWVVSRWPVGLPLTWEWPQSSGPTRRLPVTSGIMRSSSAIPAFQKP